MVVAGCLVVFGYRLYAAVAEDFYSGGEIVFGCCFVAAAARH
jgi:hypothetical protein